MKQSGIYAITNNINGKVYIGSSTDLTRRKWKHFKNLRGNTHHSPSLQHSFNKHGENAFAFTILEIVSKDHLLDREQYWMDYYLSYDNHNGYNILSTAGSCIGRVNTSEHNEKISQARQGMTFSNEHRSNISKSKSGQNHPMYNKTHSQVTLYKMSQVKLGKVFSDEHRANLSQSHKGQIPWNKGKTASPDAKLRISEAQKKRFAKQRINNSMESV